MVVTAPIHDAAPIGANRLPKRYSWMRRDQIRSLDLSNWNASAICLASR
jgi:hypothetical protein